MARPSRQPKQHHHTASRGFMEPTAGATHHEDIYGISQFEEDRAESYAFDVCDDEDDNDDDDDDGEDEDDDGGNIDETPSKRRRVSSGPSSGSRGVIKKPKYKPRPDRSPGNKADNPLDLTSEADEVAVEADEVGFEFEHDLTDPHTWFKISPRRNARHSISVAASSENKTPDPITQDVDKMPSPTTSPEDLKAMRNAEAFSSEKSKQQHQLTPSARLERRQNRERIHAVGQKAQKVKERARRDVAAAKACLVDDDDDDALLGARELYVQVERSEAPGEFVDFTLGSLKGVAKESAKSKVGRPAGLGKRLEVLRNWKGEGIGLVRGGAWVLVVVDG